MLQSLVLAQQTPVSEMYLTDYFYANPAETGRKNCLIARVGDIQQWIGIKNAPNLQTFAIHKGFKKEHKKTYYGLGGIFFHDRNGHYQSLGFRASYAFHMMISSYNNTYLSLGLTGEYAQRSLDETGFSNYNSDPSLTGNIVSVWNPNASFGILLSNNNFYSGLAILDLFPYFNSISNPVASELQNRKYSLFVGKKLLIRQNLIFEPSLMFKTNEFQSHQIDLNVKMETEDFYWLGFSYRHALDGFPGIPLNGLIYAGIVLRNWSIEYSFAFSIGSLQEYHYGTHGITLSYKLCSEERSAIPCPAYK
jgi:type IX secretion system PorP/SprF family membrane protein